MSESTWVPTPTANTVANIKKHAAGYCLHVDDPEALERAGQGIRLAIDRLNTRNWNWAIAYDDFFTVAGQTDYGLSTQFKSPRHLDLWDSGYTTVRRLEYKAPKQYLTEYQQWGSGAPCAYTCLNVHSLGTISFDAAPTPDWVSIYPNARIWYYRRVQYPGSAGGVLDIPAEAAAFVQYWADGYTADAYAVAKADAAYKRAREQLQELVRNDNDIQPDWE